MEEAFSGGSIIDIILGLMALEAIGLLALRSRLGRGPSRAEILVSLAAGVCLMIALRVALTGGPWQAIAVALVASLLTHVVDLALRWQRSQPRTPGGPP